MFGRSKAKQATPEVAIRSVVPSDAIGMTSDLCSAGSSIDDNAVASVQREVWTSKAEYLLSMIGYAVGLGNVWRFPYLAFDNGGGAFLIPYFIMLFIAGMPIFFLEVSLGQFSSQSPILAFNCVPIAKGIGFAMVMTSAYVAIYYNVIIAYTLYYFFASFFPDIPWQGCNRTWSTENCVDSQVPNNITCRILQSTTNMSTTSLTTSLPITNETDMQLCPEERISASEIHWKYRVLEITEGIHSLGNIRGELALLLLLTWFVIFLCLSKGVKSSGKAVYFTATFPYVVLTILLVRGLTLDGAAEGVRFFFEPKWHLLRNAKVWKDAATQIFYSLSAAWGGLITLSSYNKFHNNCYRDSWIVVLTNSFTSIYAGITIFAVIGFMANRLQTDITKVVSDGPGLVFVVYPEALSQMPTPNPWAVLFFLMLFTLGLDSMFATMETIIATLCDVFPDQLRKNKMILTAGLCILLYLLGLPIVTQGGFYYLHVIDSYAASYTLMICAIFESLAISYLYGVERFRDDIEMMTGMRPNALWKITWSVLSPAVLIFVFIYSLVEYQPLKIQDYVFPGWANAIGWLAFLSSALCIPAVAIYMIYREKGTFAERCKRACQPDRKWRPYLKEDRTGRYAPKPHSTIFPQPDESQSASNAVDLQNNAGPVQTG